MYDFSPQWIYHILKENNIPTPSKFKNDIDSDNIKKPKTILQSFDDSEIEYDSLIQKYKAHGFYDKDEAQRNMNIHMYAEEITGFDVWNNYWIYIRQIIYDIESDQLQSDIKEIKTGQGKIKTVDTILEQIAISSAEELQDVLNPKVAEPSKPKPEPQEDQLGEMLRFTNPQMYIKYKCITDPRIKEGFINAFNQFLQQYQQYSKLIKSKKPNPKNKNLKQKEIEYIKPKERDVDLNLQEEVKKAIISSMPKPLPKRAHNKKKNLKNGAKMK